MEEMMYNDRARNELLAKYLWSMFLLSILQIITNLITGQLGKYFPTLSTVGSVLQTICLAVCIFLLLKLAPVCLHFKQAATGLIVELVLNLIALAIIGMELEVPALTVVLALVVIVVNLYATYHKFMGYAEILVGVDDEQSQKWQSLWRLNMTAIICTAVSIFLAFIPILGVIFVLALVVFVLVIGIMELVYLYRTAQLFRQLVSQQ